ncbi:MAG TPA: hypothetical protein VGH37_13010 [Candidatus Acidoferrum sp.]
MKRSAKTSKQYALLISPRLVTRGDSISPFGTFAIRIVHIDGEQIIAPTEPGFRCLVFACNWNEKDPTEPTHSWKAFYREVWKIEHSDAEAMVKMLRKLNRISLSASASFGQYVASAANALKITLALMESKHATNTPGYHFNDYLGVKPSDVPGAIDGLVTNIRALRKAVHST